MANSLMYRNAAPTNRYGVREFSDLFDRLFDGAAAAGATALSTPASVWEQDDHYHIEMDVPGVKGENLDVTLEDGRLSVSTKRVRQDEGRSYIHDERRYGEMTRTVTLPETVDPESIKAEHRDGVLHVTVAKRPEVKPRKIEVNVG